MKTRNFIAVFAVFMIAIMLGGCNAPINVNTSTDRADMVEQYLEASVTVIAKGSYNSTGSGIAIHSGGYIATNYHVVDDVIENPETGTVSIEKIVDGQFKSYDATILWYNEDFDLAVIRSSYRNIPYVKMEDRWIDSANPLRYTEEVWALGTPIHRSLYGTYSQGYISCAKPNLPRISQESGSGRIYEHLIQHTAAISSGSSGGGLFDAEGNLLGLNSLSVVSGSGTANDLYFATPIYPLINIISEIAELHEDGDPDTNYRFPSINAEFVDRETDDYESFTKLGVLIESVDLFGVSFNKLLEDDIIVGIRGVDIDSKYYEVNLRNDFLYALSNFQQGEAVKITVLRKDIEEVVTICLGIDEAFWV